MNLHAIGVIALAAVLTFFEVSGQSNYGSQANNIEYIGDGLPEQTVLDGKVTKLDDLSPVIFLNRTKATLNCAAGSMQVELKFNDKFFGIAYADFDRNSACQVIGKGALSYQLELPLKGCGTKQEPLRVFTNNIVVRFHPGLEMDGDEVITIVCRYPPPITPEPVPLITPNQILAANPAVPIEPPLKGFHILLIICAIMFLTLLLLGLGVSYLCLRRRTIPVLARLPYSEKSGSEITKLSGSSIGNLSAFEGVKIPRAHPALMAAPSSSGSEAPLATGSDTIPSDYPSESPSEAEVGIDNRAYVRDVSDGFHSEGYVETTELHTSNAITMAAPPPAFDVQVRVKRAPPPPPSPPASTTTATDVDSLRGERNLTTIEEQFEESVRTLSPPPPPPTARQAMQALQAPPHPPRRPQHPHYAKVVRDRVAQDWDGSEIAIAPPRRPRSLASYHTEMTDTHSVTEMLDDTHNKLVSLRKKPPPPPPPMLEREEYQMEQMESLELMPETPIMPARKPEVSSHIVDDVFLRTITEKKTIEDIERHRRLVTEYRAAQRPPPEITWDVTIRNHPPSEPQWENFSDVSSVSGITLTPKSERHPLSLPPQNYIGQPGPHLFSPELVGHVRPGMPHLPELPPARNPLYQEDDEEIDNLKPGEPIPPNWDTLTRVLKREHQEEAFSEFDSSETLTHEERARWTKIITTESSLRSMLSRAVVKEDFERIRSDDRFKGLFAPIKWDVIIRILAPPHSDDKPKGGRYRKKSDFDSRSRRSSLPTLYEYDSDGGSSVRTLTNRPTNFTSRKTSRSSYKSDHVDMRSMSEMMVDYAARTEMGDNHSEASGGHIRYYADDSDSEHGFRIPRSWSQRSLQRSLSQPSLARSGSEFTERWVLPSVALLPHDVAQSPETTPTMIRRDNLLPSDRQDLSTFTSSEMRTFQSKQSWKK